MKNTVRLAVVLSTLALCAQAPQAFAEKGGHRHGKDKHEYSEEKSKHHDDDHDGKVPYFYNDDRGIITEYISHDYHSHCPPGLAKKRNGCLPPGQAKKYVVGRPYAGEWHELPDDLLGRLHPVPYGHRYVMVDKDVLLMAEGTKKIIDAITLYSAVGE